MDHEVVLGPCKIYDWVLNSSWDHFNLHQGKNVRVTMEFEVPKRHILRPTLSIDMVQQALRWERQKRCFGRKRQGPMADCYDKFWKIFFGGEIRWRQEKTREWSTLIFSRLPFLGICLKKSAHSLLGAWSFLLVHIWVTTTLNKVFSVWLYLMLVPPYPTQCKFSIFW